MYKGTSFVRWGGLSLTEEHEGISSLVLWLESKH
jgi:hypothetical protein